jgi:heterodisulfide reductase subunit C
MLKLSTDRLNELFQTLASDRTLYLPLKNGGGVDFGPWNPEVFALDHEVTLDLKTLKTVRSVKDFFFPQTENIASFRRQGKNISITASRDPAEPFIIFGARGCDVHGMEVLDKVFLCDPVDTFYRSRRENAVMISMACNEPEDTCFCGLFDVDASEPHGDVVTRVVGDALYWDAKTPKGEALTETVKNLFAQTDARDESAAMKNKEEIRARVAELPLLSLSLDGFDGDALLEKFNSPLWGILSQACVGCGTCTFVCPTCQCYDIQDFDTGHGIQRFRCWDSCMYSDFTLMAHGNPRFTQLERFRQRFMHKLVYFPANNDGMYSCVGCGRCVEKCPFSLSIVKVIRAFGGKNKWITQDTEAAV